MGSDLDDVLGFALGALPDASHGAPPGGGTGGGGTGGGGTGGAPAAALGIVALQRLLGGYQWVERRALRGARVVGRRARPFPRPGSSSTSRASSTRWHAELFAERMPAIDGVDPATYVLPPSAEADRLLATLGGGTAPGGEGIIGVRRWAARCCASSAWPVCSCRAW